MLAVALAACGSSSGDEDGADPPRPVTDAEASLLAETLFLNHEAGTSGFRATVTTASGTISLDGTVDWSAGAGTATVEAVHVDPPITEVAFADGLVYERRPVLDEVVASLGFPDARYLRRPADPSTSQLDSLLVTVAALATEQPDNAALLRQDGAEWLGSGVIDGQDVEVVRHEGIEFSIAATTGRLLRMSSVRAVDGRTVTVTFSPDSADPIAIPDEAESIAFEALASTVALEVP